MKNQDRNEKELQHQPKDKRTATDETKRKRDFPTEPKEFYRKRTEEEILDESKRRIDLDKKNRTPKPLIDLEVRNDLYVVSGTNMRSVQIFFQIDTDSNFSTARVWVKGYGIDNLLASLDPTLAKEETLPFQVMTVVNRSPACLLLEETGEEIIIGVEAVNVDGTGSGLDSMPTANVTLS